MTPPGNRQRRGGELIKDVLAEALIRDVSDPRLGFVTITDVLPSPDFASATVYFTTLTKNQRRPESACARVGPRASAGPCGPRDAHTQHPAPGVPLRHPAR